jgi:methylase of polypeptide subunit release factors
MQHLIEVDGHSLIVEVGVGSGVVPIVISDQLDTNERDKRLEYIGLDINKVACETAELNMQMHCIVPRSYLLLQSDLLDNLPVRLRGKVDIVVANIPQVVDQNLNKGGKSNFNDYYAPKYRCEPLRHNFDQRGMGLICDLLLETCGVLSDRGVVILTVAGRCGLSEIERLFAYCNMNFRIASKLITQQDLETSIESFANVERLSPFPFAFYADNNGRCQISTAQALQKFSQGKVVYHDLYAVVARPRQQKSRKFLL